jgi:cytochrome c
MAASRLRCFRRLSIAFALGAVITGDAVVVAQTPTYPDDGRTPTADELRSWDIAVGPSGKELPPGSGDALQGAVLYFSKRCTFCHGQSLEGTQYGPRLAGGQGTLGTASPVRTVGSYWAFATTLWDYINRGMPRAPLKEGSLTANEVYALTAFLLYRNGIIGVDDSMDARSLPKVRMPNRDGFLPATPDWKWYQRSCRAGNCRPQ